MDSQLSLWPLVLGPLSVTALAVPFVKRLAWRYNLVDRPETGAHKSHEQPTPYGGAIAIFCGLLLSLYVVLPYLVPILQQQAIEGICGAQQLVGFRRAPWEDALIVSPG